MYMVLSDEMHKDFHLPPYNTNLNFFICYMFLNRMLCTQKQASAEN